MDRPTKLMIDHEKQLLALYRPISDASVVKEIDFIHPLYGEFIRAAPFVVLSTGGPGGFDASPRGDHPGFVEIVDPRTLALPDRRGNNRVDSLRNVLTDPRIGLLFVIPGVGETLRVNGTAKISIDPQDLERFSVEGKPPRTVLIVTVISVYFQCSRAVVRAGLWDPARHVARSSLPSVGKILAAVSRDRVDGNSYDRDLESRIKSTLY